MKHCTLTAIILIFTHLTVFEASAAWRQVWSDDFNYTGLPDSTKWGYDVGGSGWGNQELQYYTKADTANACAANGVLTITALKKKIQQNDYSSARLISKNKGDWLYGRFEIAAKLPKGKGLWPAIWMLPTDGAYGGWPKSGEIDIMENVGFEPNIVHFTVHTEAYNHSIGTSKGASATLADPYTKFVVYVLEWNKDSMAFYADDKKTFSFKNEGSGSKVWPFDKRFHLLLNIAVGGSWGGQQGVDEGICPAKMIIDYVRVYGWDGMAVTESYEKKTLPRQPVVSYVNKRLRIASMPSGAASVSIFTVGGVAVRTLSGERVGAAEGCPAALPRGMYVVVVGCGREQQRMRFMAVD